MADTKKMLFKFDAETVAQIESLKTRLAPNTIGRPLTAHDVVRHAIRFLSSQTPNGTADEPPKKSRKKSE